MSGRGAPEPARVDGSALKIGVVAACWHAEVMDGLLAGARHALARAHAPEPQVVRVPGSFELPVATKALATSGCDAVIALGVVIRGETPHFEYVARATTDGLSRVALETGVPVGFGVLTCDDEQQARQRAGLLGSLEDKGAEAADAALVTAIALRRLSRRLDVPGATP